MNYQESLDEAKAKAMPLMLEVKKQFVVDEENRKVAVLIDLPTFERIEDLLENYVLAQKMEESVDSESLPLDKAKAYYSSLRKDV